MRPSTKAWAVLGAGVVAYDILAPQGETLSEGLDTAVERHPLITTLAVGAVALHLCNALSPERDIIHLATQITRRHHEP